MDTRIASEVVVQREVIDQLLSRLNTCVPGVVESFDPATQTVTVTPAVEMKVGATLLQLPPIIRCPVIVPMAAVNGFALTLPIATGDPCLIHFSQRCIDNWLELGGVQPPENAPGDSRHHALTDALVTFAPTPLNAVFANWLTTGIELRNRARNSRITVLDDKVEIHANTCTVTVLNDGTVTVVAPTEVILTTPLVHCTGDISDGIRTLAADRAIYNTHTHPDPGGGNTGVPNQQE